MRRAWTLFVVLPGLLFYCGTLFAQETTASPFPLPTASPEPLITTTEPFSYKIKKFYLFPFNFPSYLMGAVTYPFAQLSNYLEAKPAFRSTMDYFFKKRGLVLFPELRAGGTSRLGIGLGVRHYNLFEQDYYFALDYYFYLNLDNTLDALLRSPPIFYLGKRPFFFVTLTNFQYRNNERYFGTGPQTPEQDKSEYGITALRLGYDLGYQILPELELFFPLRFYLLDSRDPRGNGTPSVAQTFPDNELPGFQNFITYASVGVILKHDTRNNFSNPSRGGYRSLELLLFQGLNTQNFNYGEFTVDVHQYFPLWSPMHVLVLRNRWVFQESYGGSQIPFYRLADLGIDSPLRGFDRGRFRDTSSVLFNVEYRYPIWEAVQGSLFFDTGKVFGGLQNFSFDDWRYSGGGGLRFFYRGNFLFRVDVGYGGEGVHAIFTVKQSI